MTQPITPAATPTPAPAAPVVPVTPAAPAAATPAVPVTPAAATPAAPVTPATPAAPAKSLLEQAIDPAAPKAVETDPASEALTKAVEAFQADPSPENKALVDKAAADAKTAIEAAKAKPATPEKYEMKPGEGQTIDDALLADVTPILKEAGITNDQLTTLGPIAVKIQEKAIAAYISSQATVDAERDAAEAKTSKEVLGAQFQEKLGLVAKARDRFFSAESKAILAKHGNNINLIQDLIKLGQSISEGKLVDGKPDGAEKSATSVLYPSMAQT